MMPYFMTPFSLPAQYWNDTLAARAQARIRCSSWRQQRRARLGVNVNVGKFRNNRRRYLDRLFSTWFSQRDYFSHTRQFQGCSPWYSCLQYRAVSLLLPLHINTLSYSYYKNNDSKCVQQELK